MSFPKSQITGTLKTLLLELLSFLKAVFFPLGHSASFPNLMQNFAFFSNRKRFKKTTLSITDYMLYCLWKYSHKSKDIFTRSEIPYMELRSLRYRRSAVLCQAYNPPVYQCTSTVLVFGSPQEKKSFRSRFYIYIYLLLGTTTLQRDNTENSKQIILKKELRGHSTTIHIYMSVSDLYFNDRSAYSAAGKYVERSWEYINHSQTHKCENWV